MDFELSARASDGCVIVEINGECDVSTAEVLRELLLAMLAGPSAKMVLDLSGLDFLDCATARALLAVYRRATLLGGVLAIAAPTPRLLRLLRLTGLARRLAIFPTVGAALAAIRPELPGPPGNGGQPRAGGQPRRPVDLRPAVMR